MNMNGSLLKDKLDNKNILIKICKGVQINLTTCFEILYFLNLLFLLLMRTSSNSTLVVISKFRYVYIACLFCFIALILYKNTSKADWAFLTTTIKLFIPFILHTFLFCCIFTNETIDADTKLYLQELVIYIFSLILTVYFVVKFGLFDDVLKLTYWCFALFMVYCYITHFNGFAPFRYIFQIFSSDRVRFLFGFDNYVEPGAYAGVALTLSFYLIFIKKEYSFKHAKIELLIQLVLDIALILILVSTATRGAIVELLMFVFATILYNARKYFKLKVNKRVFRFLVAILCFVAVILFFALDVFVFMWELSGTRISNFTTNLEIFEQYANQWIGLGYASHSLYLSKGYGYSTFALDVMYLYFYYSTGIIGITLIVWQLIVWALNLFKPNGDKSSKRFLVCVLFLLMLFDGFFEISFFFPQLVSNFSYLVLLISYCVSNKQKKKRMELHCR